MARFLIVSGCIALSGVLPLIISPKQRPFYLVPTLPLFAMSFALFIDNFISDFSEKLRRKSIKKTLKITTFAIFFIAFIIMTISFGKTNRRTELIEDIDRIENIIGENRHLSISENLFEDWYLHAYFQRLHRVSLTTTEDLEYKLTSHSDTTKYPNYSIVELNLHGFTLMKQH